MLCTAWALYAQTGTDTQTIFSEAQATLYSNTDKAQKSAEYLIKNATATADKTNALLLLAKINNLKGQYTTATDLLFEAAAIANTQKSDADVAVALAAQCRILGIKDKAAYYLNRAETALGNNAAVHYEKALQHVAFYTPAKALPLLNGLIKKSGNVVPKELLYNDIALAHLQLKDFNSAADWYKKSEAMAKTNTTGLYAQTMLCTILVARKNYNAAVETSLKLLPRVLTLQDITLKATVYKNLADSYAALNDNANYKTYSEQYDLLTETVNDQGDKARIALLNHIDKDYELQQAQEDSHYNLILWGAGSALLLFVVVAIVYGQVLNRNYRQYTKIIGRLEESENVKPAEIIVPESKTYAISEKTEKNLLEKLARFEESGRFTGKTISLNSLAKQLDTNTKYLSDVINTHKNGNFNAYINELRIKYILKKLQTDPVYLNYKVSYLAEESGFSSHSAFATVFKTVTGISPTTYITFLKKEAELPDNNALANHE